jgi:hypothetical protein
VRTATWNVGILYVQTDINKCKIANQKERSKNGADWEKPIKEAKVCIGLQCHRIIIIIIINLLINGVLCINFRK